MKTDIVIRITDSVIEVSASRNENFDLAISLNASFNQNKIILLFQLKNKFRSLTHQSTY
jgi:hypothetical protein